MPSSRLRRRGRIAAALAFLACISGVQANADIGDFILQGLGVSPDAVPTTTATTADSTVIDHTSDLSTALTTPSLPSGERVAAAKNTKVSSGSSTRSPYSGDFERTSSDLSTVLTTPSLPGSDRVAAAKNTGGSSGSSARSSYSGDSVKLTTTSSSTTASGTTTTARSVRAWTVPANGSGTAYASACLSERGEFQRLLRLSTDLLPSTMFTTSASSSRTTLTASITTLCDGMPRVVGSISLLEVHTSRWTWSYLTAAQPSCSVRSTDCAVVCSSLKVARSSWLSQNLVTLAMPAIATVMTVADAAGTNTVTLGPWPIDGSGIPTLTLFNNTYEPDYFSTLWRFDASPETSSWLSVILIPGSSATVSRPDLPSPPDCQIVSCDGFTTQEATTQVTTPATTQVTTSTEARMVRRCDETCHIAAYAAQIIRFPVTQTTSQDMCALTPPSSLAQYCPGGITISTMNTYGSFWERDCTYLPLNTSTTTEANSGPYAVHSGMTFYQNRVYLSLNTVGAFSCGTQIGPLINTILTLHSSDLYSVCLDAVYSATAYPYDFYDGPVPASAWNCQPWCGADMVPWVDFLQNDGYKFLEAGGKGYMVAPTNAENHGICVKELIQGGSKMNAIIAEEFYRPLVALPVQLRAAHPLWASCGINLQGAYDPPIVLTAESTAAAATLASPLRTTAANPAPGIATSLTPAKATATLQAPTALPTSSQQVVQFTFDPSTDSPNLTAASDGGLSTDTNAPITISAIVIPQLEQPLASTAPGLAAAPATLKSPSALADPDPITSANRPANGNGPSNVDLPSNGKRPPNDDGPANGNGLPNGNGATNGQSPDSVTAFAIGSQTARPGGPAVTASGTTFSALPSGAGVQVIVSGLTSTIGLATPGIAAPSSQAGNILIGSQTLLPGGQAVTQAGTIWSALPSRSGVQVVADGKTSTVIPQAPGIAALSSQPGNILIGSQTLVPGGPAVTQAGTIWSALPSGSGVQIVANGHTSTVIPQAPGVTAAAFLKAGILIGSQTLTPGGPAITSAGTTWSALPSGSGVRIIVNGHTSTIGPVALAIAPAPVSTSNSGAGVHPFTAPANNNSTSPTTSGLALRPVGPTSQSAWTIGGNHIITKGQAWTANGTIFSDISGTLFTGLASSSISTALVTVIKQGAAVQIRDFSWGSGLAAGFSVLSGVLAVFL